METFYSILIVSVCLISGLTNQEIMDIFEEQRMIDDEEEFIPYKFNLINGESCINSIECLSGCCLSRKKGRQCAPKSLKDENCTSVVTKGEIYVDHCPCIAGSDACSKNKYELVGICTS